ncbi:MAG: AAA family ATPase [Bacteroidia bacterium]
MISTIAEALDLKFSAFSLHPDLMPGDILGTEILEIDEDTNKKHFKFIKGPVFHRQYYPGRRDQPYPLENTGGFVGSQEKGNHCGETHKLSEPFFVLAAKTRSTGRDVSAFALPEAQLDRLMFNTVVDYPSIEEEIEIVKRTSNVVPEINTIISQEEIMYFPEACETSTGYG